MVVKLELKPGEDAEAGSVVRQAVSKRFMQDVEMDPNTYEVQVSTAATIAPTRCIAKDAKIVAGDDAVAAEMPSLWLHVELSNAVLALLRAKATDALYAALKTEAGIANITFSDTNFAALLGKKCAVLCKALGRSAVEGTPGNGSFVIKVEERVASYREVLGLLKRDLTNLTAAKESFAQPPPGAGTAQDEEARSCDSNRDLWLYRVRLLPNLLTPAGRTLPLPHHSKCLPSSACGRRPPHQQRTTTLVRSPHFSSTHLSVNGPQQAWIELSASASCTPSSKR